LTEASGIFNWLLEGWKLVQRAWQIEEVALPEPAEVRMATQEYRQEQSQVARFFAENYRVASHESDPMPAADVYNCYTMWTTNQGEHFKKNLTAFGLELARYLTPYKTVSKRPHGKKNVVSWFGIEKIDTGQPQGTSHDKGLPF